jgi:ABC-2 type transport system ATP-binding protein
MIETHELTKRFDTFLAVNRVSLTVPEGEVLALLGPNGAGKTTTVRMLTSILRPTSGWARVAGHDVVGEPAAVRRSVGVLTEHHGLYMRMRAEEYLRFFGQLYGLPAAVSQQRAARLLEQFGMGDALQKRLGEYSKGMRQNLTEAEQLADHIAVIRRGSLIAQGSPRQLKRQWLGPALLELRTAGPLNGALSEIASLAPVVDHGPSWVRFLAEAPEAINPRILQRLAENQVGVVTLAEIPRSLEDVYLQVVSANDPF